MTIILNRPNATVKKGADREKKILSQIRIIACGAFRTAFGHLQLEKRYPHLLLTFLPFNLHVRPQELKQQLFQEVIAAQKKNERIICLYGNCFPDIDDFCKCQGIIRMPGAYCYEMLLGIEQFQKIIDETAGTYFLEREVILNFEEYFMEPLELYDEEMRIEYFRHYQKLLYVRQPSDQDLVQRAKELAIFLELSLEVRDADYSYLKNKLVELIEIGPS